MSVNLCSDKNHWNILCPDIVSNILSYAHSIKEIVGMAAACTEFRDIIFKDTSIWKSRKFAFCLQPNSCWCSCIRMNKKFTLMLLSKCAFTDLTICGGFRLFGRCLFSLSQMNTVRNFEYLTLRKNKRDIKRGLIFPKGLKCFDCLQTFTYNSAFLGKIDSKVFANLLRCFGEKLRKINFYPSSPIGIIPHINLSCPALTHLRIDSLEKNAGDSLICIPTLEEMELSYPVQQFEYDDKIEVPQLKKCIMSGVINESSSNLALLHAIPDCLLELELGDSPSCASNEVLTTIGTCFPNLQKLTLKSDDQANSISAHAMIQLSHGCPKLSHLDLGGALVWYEEGVIESMGNFPYLRRLHLGYSFNIVPSIFYLLKVSSSLEELVLVVQGDDDSLLYLANSHRMSMTFDHPRINIIIDET